ncbi:MULTISPECIES: Nramp family divalent metal transporter [unclassified Mesorhizobium]|uniref:Nramp family divalent metal transporter n=1 Tax=unclassified Mesorhizobium TaxID=325217 RepID=UPI001129519A|nr:MULTISPECIES: Nramp family divalent metal transporter [unclassified Mesorhizobium]TPJ40171.1 divalent metal cation transporter [Mesorhizobium sp. B2-6-6]MCA0002476.1 Nramp family divalent metal transporter [Mesorhizobium sp. B264B2A]MCA0008386.1 Nramp family divalent metal transporter [Mesorhizobium sp. B264B1B]MCA0016961.1 Nramp family divalent metal transporter [Mesorhizobium sp. B264B1A]TPJ49059.1 divalent metal cation transporter [Mesorhizobium sp. B2-6-4]
MSGAADDAGRSEGERKDGGITRALGLGLITGAADDDCSAIGTYASAGARFGPDLLWTAPVTLPMMYIVVYLSSKLGQVSGRGLFKVISDFYPRWLLWSVLVGVLIGNTIEAAADLGAMSAAVVLFVPLPSNSVVIGVAMIIFALQMFGSYKLIRNIFRWLALALLAYVVSAVLAKPDVVSVLRGTLLPKIEFSREYLSIIVAIIGTTLSAYLYTWQSNQEVEEEIAKGRTSLEERKGATEGELRRSRRDILIGMIFSNLIMYFIILSTGSTLYEAGHTQIETAAQAAEALRPLAGDAAGILFAAGVIGVGFLAVPVMTAGAAFDFAQAMGWKNGLNAKPRHAPKFYIATGVITLVAVVLNFFGFNPMKALVWSGIVQGFSTPPLLFLMLIMTNNRKIMGDKVNSRATNILGGVTTIAVFAASAGLVATWFM